MLLLDTVAGTIYSTRSYLLYCRDKGYEIAETKNRGTLLRSWHAICEVQFGI